MKPAALNPDCTSEPPGATGKPPRLGPAPEALMQLAEQDQALEKARRLGLSVLSLTQALPSSRFLNPSYILSFTRVKILEAVGVAIGSSPGHFPLLQLIGSALPSDATVGGVQGAGSYCCSCMKRMFRNVGMTEPSMILVSKVCCVPFLV